MPEVWAEAWKEYGDAVKRRLRSAQRVYGNTALERPPMELARELQCELEDIAGWAVWIWWRLEEFKKGLQQVQLDLVRAERLAQQRQQAPPRAPKRRKAKEKKGHARKKSVHGG